MSLINQMLQDLDARREAHGVGVTLPNDVRPLPPVQASRLPWALAALAGTVAAAMGAYLVLREPAAPVPAVAVAQAVPVPVAVPPVAAPEPADPPAAPTERVTEAPAVNAEGGLRLADVLSSPETRPAVKPAAARSEALKKPAETRPVTEKPANAKPEPSRREKPPEMPSASVSESRTMKNASIEKTEAAVQPRDRAETAYRKAIASVNQGRVNEALDILHDVLRIDGLHVASRQLLVRLLLEARRVDEAVQVLQEGLQAQPAHTGWAMSLARLQVDRGDLDGAAQTLQQSLPAAFGNPDYLGFAGHLQQRLGHGKDAADLYQAAARLAPNDGRWWLGLGLAMESEGRNDQALAAFLRARQCGNLSRELAALVEQKLRQ